MYGVGTYIPGRYISAQKIPKNRVLLQLRSNISRKTFLINFIDKHRNTNNKIYQEPKTNNTTNLCFFKVSSQLKTLE